MQDLDDQVQKLRAIYLDSATAVPMKDEAAANKALEAYQSLQHATDRLFDLLIVLENTDQTVGTVRSLANHFFLANVLDNVSEPIAEALNNIAACLPGIAQPDGTRIPSGPVQPGASPSPQVTAFVKALDNESAWLEAMLIGRAFTVLKRFPFSNARTKAVADAATRIKRFGYAFSIRSGRYQISSEGIENIVGQIWKCLQRVGSLNALSNIMRVALETQDYAYEQILFGRKYAGGLGYRPPGLPIGLLYNIAVKLPALGSNERNARSFWDKALGDERDRSARRGARLDSSRPCDVLPCAWYVTTDATACWCSYRAPDMLGCVHAVATTPAQRLGVLPARSPSRISLPRYGSQVGLRIVLFEACSAFTRVTACTLALSPYFVTRFTEGFNRFVTSTIAPVASGWSGCRAGLAPAGKAPPLHGARHERSFDTDHYIGNNLRAALFSAHSHGDRTNSHCPVEQVWTAHC